VAQSAVAAGTVTQPAVTAGAVVRPVAGAVVAGSVMTADAVVSDSVAGESAVAAVSAVVAVSAVSTETAVAAVTSETAELPFFRLFGRGPGRYQRHGQSEEDDLKQLTRDQDHLRGWLVHSWALTVYWFMVKKVTDSICLTFSRFYTVSLHPRYSEENAQNDGYEWDISC